jgi:hypothetical protein
VNESQEIEAVAVTGNLPPGQAPVVILTPKENRPIRSKGGPTLAQYREKRKAAKRRAKEAKRKAR